MAINTKYVQAQTFQLSGAGVSAGDTTMTVNNFTQIDGTTLSMSNFGITGYGTVEPGSGINEEQISWTSITDNGDGTSTLSGVDHVLDVYPYTGTAGFNTDHTGGVNFVITNTAGFYNTFANKSNDETITGAWSGPTPTISAQFATKGYVDGVVLAGAPPASTTTPGISVEATQTQVDAKTTSFTFSGTPYQLFVNPGTVRSTLYNDYKVDSGTANAYAIAPTPAISTYTAGQQFTFQILNTNSGPSTLNVNSLGNKSVVKNINQALTGGELTSGGIVTCVYDGTNMQIQSTTLPSALIKYTSGVTTKNASDASTTQNIAHSLGVIPKRVRITAYGTSGANENNCTAYTVYNGSTQSSTSVWGNSNSYSAAQTFTLNTNVATNGDQTGVVTLTSTNIVITWTKTSSPTGFYNLVWEAEG